MSFGERDANSSSRLVHSEDGQRLARVLLVGGSFWHALSVSPAPTRSVQFDLSSAPNTYKTTCVGSAQLRPWPLGLPLRCVSNFHSSNRPVRSRIFSARINHTFNSQSKGLLVAGSRPRAQSERSETRARRRRLNLDKWPNCQFDGQSNGQSARQKTGEQNKHTKSPPPNSAAARANYSPRPGCCAMQTLWNIQSWFLSTSVECARPSAATNVNWLEAISRAAVSH